MEPTRLLPGMKYLDVYIPNRGDYFGIPLTSELTTHIKQQWANKCPFVLAIYPSSDKFVACPFYDLVKLNVNPQTTEIFFHILYSTKKGIKNAYIGTTRVQDENIIDFINDALKAADGDEEAIYQTGKAYYCGENTLIDYKIARKYLKISAYDHKYKGAFLYLGHIYKKNPEIRNAQEKMIRSFTTAALHGKTAASYEMGMICYEDIRMPNHLSRAFVWFLHGANNGCGSCQWKLAKLFQTGAGVEKDKEKSFYWLVLSAENGNENALLHIRKIERNSGCKRLLGESYLKLAEHCYEKNCDKRAEELLDKSQFYGNRVAAFLYSQIYRRPMCETLRLLAYHFDEKEIEKSDLLPVEKTWLKNLNLTRDEAIHYFELAQDLHIESALLMDVEEENLDHLEKEETETDSEREQIDKLLLPD